ncbi:hypothetical protein NDU88_007869 [Pleurodeles waltl]|uniref:Uncharacterized protein n=1 Tax=Pleurodeles waltl TaxID=8319 RepID=A0AAV7QNB1_PLEWA|nr:hypothetical protein NDU88_007869 [Pleurodeles waltl]
MLRIVYGDFERAIPVKNSPSSTLTVEGAGSNSLKESMDSLRRNTVYTLSEKHNTGMILRSRIKKCLWSMPLNSSYQTEEHHRTSRQRVSMRLSLE